MTEVAGKKNLRVGQYGYSLDIIDVGKRGFCYFDGERYNVKAGASIRKWAEVIVITLVPEATVIETWSVFPLSYELSEGGFQSVGESNPLPVIETGLRTITAETPILNASKTLLLQYLSMHPTGIPFHLEDWQYPRGWSLGGSVDGGLQRLEIDYGMSEAPDEKFAPNWTPQNGKHMAKVLSSGILGSEWVTLIKNFGALPKMRLGFETWVAWPYDRATLNARCGQFGIGFHYMPNSSDYYWAMCYVQPPNDRLVALTTAGVQQAVYNFPTGESFETLGYGCLVWHNMKLIVDFSTLPPKYVKLYFDDIEVSLSGVTVYHSPVAGYRHLKAVFGICQAGAVTQYITYLGNTILTMDEP